MEIREVGRWTSGTVERRLIGHKLNQIARDEPGGDPEMPQDMDQQPGAVAAGSGLQRQGLLGILDAGFHANDVAYVAGEPAVEADEEIDAARALAIDARKKSGKQRTRRADAQEWRNLLGQCRIVGERQELRVRLEKEIEGFGELFRWISFQKIGTSTIQSRAMGGVAGGTYLFALPGSTGACKDGWDEILRFQLDSRHRPCNLVELMPRLLEHLKPV